jgi:hypothetical protein
MNGDTRGTTQHMMMLEANCYQFHKSTSSCMATLDSRTSNHSLTTMKRYVRKSSSMTLNEALCGRQPDLFIYLYKLWQVYIVFFIWKLQVTLHHCSSKCHNHILYVSIDIEWALCYLNFGKLLDHLFLCFLVFRVFFVCLCLLGEKYEAWSLLIVYLWLVNLG